MDHERTPLLGRRDSEDETEKHEVCSRVCPCSSRYKYIFSCGAVLLTETFERIAFYGLVGNLVMFLNKNPLDWTSYNAANALFVFTGISYLTSLFGGWLADAVLGKFKTISIFFIFYIGSYAVFPLLVRYPEDKKNMKVPGWCGVISQNGANTTTVKPGELTTQEWYVVSPGDTIPSPGREHCALQIYLALTVMGLANGVIKANIAPFGADQVNMVNPRGKLLYVQIVTPN
jgi:peptide/histidine transporter 3/4